MTEKGWHEFLTLCLAVRDEKLLSELFELFFTAEERASLATRYLIVKALLDQKETQREMSDELSVSIAKITRGSNELKRISAKLKQFLQKNL
ncbi:MAG TPA: trp operon repressor [Gammaproteobacteria bacterium]|jgi:TrpR family trp operon transcriptional repressor|nr:trp operon repressor [Gammaproteobacteria bacterium]